MSLITQHYFALFGLPEQYQQCTKEIKKRYIKLQQEIHPDRFVQGTEQALRLAVDYAAQVNQAYRTLLDPILRAIYVLKCQHYEWKDEASVTLPIAFLGEQMELREQLALLKQAPDDSQLEIIKKTMTEHMAILTDEVQHWLDVDRDVEKAALCVRKMQFYAKLTDEIEALESACQY